MAVSSNSQHIALYADSGYLFLGSVNLREKYYEYVTSMKDPLTDIAWLVIYSF
jgi:hypothetical protein